MPTADVVVVGVGLAGLSAAVRLAEAGARVEVVARGHAATHWTAGGFDIAAPPDAGSSADGVSALAMRERHPYALLQSDLGPALAWLRSVLTEEGLAYVGELEDPLAALPTAIGGTRRAAIVPAQQAAGLAPWRPGERLVVCGVAGFKDFWAESIALSLRRLDVWAPSSAVVNQPGRVDSITVELPELAGRQNLSSLEIARHFDDRRWREVAFGIIARAAGRRATPAGVRIAVPAVLGLADHAEALRDGQRLLPAPFFEVPLVPPSIPGMRLYDALRAALRRRGGRIIVGEAVTRIEASGDRVTAVAAPAAVRERVIRTGGLVIATGGIAGGGLVGLASGTLEEPLLGLPVEAPPPDEWLADDPFDPAGHPLEAAGIRTDAELRPVDAAGHALFGNVAVVGAMLAGQRYLTERSGDGVAIASGFRAAAVLGATSAAPLVAVGDRRS